MSFVIGLKRASRDRSISAEHDFAAAPAPVGNTFLNDGLYPGLRMSPIGIILPMQLFVACNKDRRKIKWKFCVRTLSLTPSQGVFFPGSTP